MKVTEHKRVSQFPVNSRKRAGVSRLLRRGNIDISTQQIICTVPYGNWSSSLAGSLSYFLYRRLVRGERAKGLIVKSQPDKLIRPGTELMKLLERPGENRHRARLAAKEASCAIGRRLNRLRNLPGLAAGFSPLIPSSQTHIRSHFTPICWFVHFGNRRFIGIRQMFKRVDDLNKKTH